MQDLTQGSEYKALFRFMLPILVGNIFQQFYNVADSIIVGQVLGKENLAAVGFCFQINLIIVALSMGLTLGTSILVSKHYGAQELDRIGTVIDTGFLFSLVVSVLGAVVGVLSAGGILRLFQVPEDTFPYAYIYLRILFVGMVPTFLYNTMTNILRGLGDSRSPVYFLIAAALMNIVLDILFVRNLGMGIAGAAYATIASQFFSFFGSFVYMYIRYPRHRIQLLHPSLDLGVLRDSLKIGVPSMMQQVFRSLGFMTLQGMVNTFGTNCMAAYAAATKIDSFAQLPALNMGQALSNFTAQNRGAKREDRARRGFKAALVMALTVTIAITLVIYPNPDLFVGLFSSDAEVLAIGREYLRIVSIFYCVDATMQALNGILLGYEKPFVPMVSTIVSLCIMQVPAAFLLSHTALGYTGIWLATPFGWLGGVAIRYYYFRRYVSRKEIPA